jgi:hypothetical protein
MIPLLLAIMVTVEEWIAIASLCASTFIATVPLFRHTAVMTATKVESHTVKPVVSFTKKKIIKPPAHIIKRVAVKLGK